MAHQDRALAVALRGAQWALDDAAYAIPNRQYTAQQCHDLANILENLAQVLRAHDGERPTPTNQIPTAA
ncbi:hypothetical protein [Saccharopolyspora sp. NPDC050642]|uniref:hypothetical protein n=1 Tax=Saccharopolyspora sp. NPDC050642 TaxID=3157099 RepID=UPI0033DE2A4B